MVAYFFPPLGGAGVQRSLKFAKYLPQEGWDLTVLTVRARDYWMVDESLTRELTQISRPTSSVGRVDEQPQQIIEEKSDLASSDLGSSGLGSSGLGSSGLEPGVQVIRTTSLTGLALIKRLVPKQAGRHGQPRGSSKALRRLRRLASWFLLPDAYRGWVPFATRAGAKLLEAQPFDLIYTTSSPDSAHLVGLSLSRRFRLPWVADFRDPWTHRMSFQPPTRWHSAWQSQMERRVLREATLVTVTADETREDFLRLYPELPPEKIQVVTNGFDEEDFAPWNEVHPQGDRMQILHAGQLNPERPAKPFLEGLRRLVETQPHARERLRVRFLGPHYAGDPACAKEMGLERIVGFESGRPHHELVRELLTSHLLLLMEQDSERGGLILPGKIFEYLRTRRPILALLPPGAAWNLITRLQAGRCCRTGDSRAVAEALGAYLREFERGGIASTGLAGDDLLAFERHTLARRLASLIEPLCS